MNLFDDRFSVLLSGMARALLVGVVYDIQWVLESDVS